MLIINLKVKKSLNRRKNGEKSIIRTESPECAAYSQGVALAKKDMFLEESMPFSTCYYKLVSTSETRSASSISITIFLNK